MTSVSFISASTDSERASHHNILSRPVEPFLSTPKTSPRHFHLLHRKHVDITLDKSRVTYLTRSVEVSTYLHSYLPSKNRARRSRSFLMLAHQFPNRKETEKLLEENFHIAQATKQEPKKRSFLHLAEWQKRLGKFLAVLVQKNSITLWHDVELHDIMRDLSCS